MPAAKNALRPLVIFIVAIAALLSSGCVWGIVRDAETNAPIAGATVTYTDADGNTATTTTNASGWYAFDIAAGPVPVVGSADFVVSAAGYHTKTESRAIAYDDNPGATLSNPSSFWEVQHFTLREEGAQAIEARLVAVDISEALLGGTTDYIVAISAYDPDDPGGSLCHLEAGPYALASADPPSQALGLECSVPGDTLEVRVYVGVRRTYATKAPEHDISTAGFSWDAPSLETGWRTATLDSADVDGPDDPDLAFTATLQYRSVETTP
ncbi:MAG: carboxypeptidase regulatory-like domain-containing protein [Dehalococcoidia bacterium]|nr:carboxypeptidase regulatory-like domain-containing protein [Dehalococcoidia bacterium]